MFSLLEYYMINPMAYITQLYIELHVTASYSTPMVF